MDHQPREGGLSDRSNHPLRPVGVLAALALAAAFAGAAQAESEATPKPLSKAYAEPPRIADSCESGDLRMAGAPMFRVAGRGRLHMLEMSRQCFSARCGRALAPYITRADVVFGGPEQRGVRCVEYGTRQGTLRAGFVPAANLAPAEAERVLKADFLVGVWRDGANSIRVAANRANRLVITGAGVYKGTGPTPNEGGFNAEAPIGPTDPLVLRDGGCIVVLERRGPFLLANDNERCGGNNVRFVGIYVRRTGR